MKKIKNNLPMILINNYENNLNVTIVFDNKKFT
jgi:hypothetical protein